MSKEITGGRGRRAVATLGAIALGLMGAAAFSAPAAAAEAPNHPDGPYSITIHKYEQPAVSPDAPHDGTEVDTTGLGQTPLEGVTYQVQLVQGIDLTTNAGWETTETLTAADAAANYTLGAAISDGTDANGMAYFPGLTVGVYLVTEADAGTNNITQLADPFLVTVPFPNNNEWLTDVHVYPKNPVAGVEKTVDDSDAYGLGDTVNWEITAKVPNIPDGQELSSFAVTDQLDTRLDYTPTATVTLADGTTDVPLDSSDYTITAPSAGNSNTLSVDFTASGIAKLVAAGDGVVTVSIATTVNSVGDGTITNTGVLNVNDSSFDSTPASSTWGSLTIKKVDEQENPLEGAQFQVYKTEADALAGTNPVSVDGEDTFTSGADGIVSIDGLKSQENGAGDNLTYYIVETRAPVGYTVSDSYTPENPTAVTITPGSTTNEQLIVVNPQVPAFELPLTGSTGTALFIGGGIALIAIALGTAFVAYRRKSHLAVQE